MEKNIKPTNLTPRVFSWSFLSFWSSSSMISLAFCFCDSAFFRTLSIFLVNLLAAFVCSFCSFAPMLTSWATCEDSATTRSSYSCLWSKNSTGHSSISLPMIPSKNAFQDWSAGFLEPWCSTLMTPDRIFFHISEASRSFSNLSSRTSLSFPAASNNAFSFCFLSLATCWSSSPFLLHHKQPFT